MKKIILSVLVFAAAQSFAQTTVFQVIVLNEGHYNWITGMQDVPVSIGSYNPATHLYSTFETVAGAQFATDIVIDGNYIYAACSNGIRKYDKATKQLLDTNSATAVRKMVVWNNELLVTRGDVGLGNYYFQSYNKNDLSFNYQLDNVTGPVFSAEGIAVYGDSCYVAMNNAFNFPNYVGKIGVVYLPSQTYVREFDLGAIGINPDYMTIENDKLYTVNNRDYSNASITGYDVNTGTLTTTDLSVSSGCGTSVYASGDLLYQVAGEQTLKKFSTASLSTYDSLMVSQSIYGLAHDAVNNLLYAGITDYVSFGKIFIYYNTGAVADSFDVSVAPGSIAIDYSGPLAVNQLNKTGIEVYPNPASDFIVVRNAGNYNLKIYNAIGEVVREEKINPSAALKIDVSDFKPGIYFVKLNNGNSILSEKFIRQ